MSNPRPRRDTTRQHVRRTPGGSPRSNVYRSSSNGYFNRNHCEKKEECGTCRFINGDYKESLNTKFSEQLNLFEERGLFEKAQVLAPVQSPTMFEYRAHAKLAVRPANLHDEDGTSRFAMGLFKPGTHEVVDVGHCPLHKRTINFLVRDLQKFLDESELTPYNEETGEGILRYIAVRASHLTSELMVTFVVTSDASGALRKLISALRQQGHNITSAHMNLHGESGNQIFGEENRRLAGVDRLRERVCELDFEIGPSSFFQVNPWVAEIIYRRIEQLAGQRVVNQVAWDLYSGIGALSMILARAGYRVLGIEENPQAVRDAQLNATRNSLTTMPYFMVGRVEDAYPNIPTWAAEPQVLVVNPSRRGLAAPVRQFIADVMDRVPGLSLLYMSCEAASLTRDLEDFKQRGCHLRQLEAFDMFPFTEKLEWLAVISK